MGRFLVAASAILLLFGCHKSAFTSPVGKTPDAVWDAENSQALGRFPVSIFPPGASLTSGVTEHEQRVTAIATAHWSTCALLEDHSLWCWGEHAGGVGDSRDWPRQIPLTGVTKLIGANERYLAITQDGRLHYWGHSFVKDSPNLDTAMPTPLSLNDVVDAAASSNDVCALQRSGKITCWVGDSPAVSANLPGARRLARSRQLTCALLESGKVACLDGNQTPVLRAEVTDAVELVAAGNSHCALRREGDVVCWPEGAQARSVADSLGTSIRRLTSSAYAFCAFKASGVPRCIYVGSPDNRQKGALPPERVFPPNVTLSDAHDYEVASSARQKCPS